MHGFSEAARNMVKDPAAISVYSRQALQILRDPSTFKWYVIPLLVIVIYIYHVQMQKKNWNVVFAGLALWGADWFNEMWNGLVFYFTQRAPLWCAPGGDTAYLIFIGLNIEICLMFAILGVVATIVLPEDRKMKVLGIPNRWFFIIFFTTLSVMIEIVLNALNALTWDYSWWSAKFPVFIWLAGYFWFYLIAYWVHDMDTVRKKALVVGTLFGIDIVTIAIFGGVLGWI
jgi:hypothetical protein